MVEAVGIENDGKGSASGLEIAVIGMAVRFPGAANVNEFLCNLKAGVESITFFSREELIEAGEQEELLRNSNYVNAFGYMHCGDCFDSAFFGYTPMEAAVLDPQLRVFLECTWEALEDAGYEPGSYEGLIGLYAGAASNPFWQLLSLMPGAGQGLDFFSVYQLNNKDNLTTWVSYLLDLKGPSFAMQTACSTSLVAIHMACQGLLSGESNMALAGGAAITYPRGKGYTYREGLTLSPDGHCRAFDASAQGTTGGEGCGVVVLKLLEDAVKDRDHIYAVIKGSAINNDGKFKTGYTAPSVKGQAAVISAALKMAEVEPTGIGYIEAHGTATVLGDPIEIEALKQVFGAGERGTCGIGSVKSNFGHLDAAAGVAGFVKTVLSLKEKVLFPNLHFTTPNPKIDFVNSPFFVPTGLKPWKNNHAPLRAGVSSFGIGGTNCHIVLEEAPAITETTSDRGTSPGHPLENLPQLLLLSARTPTALEKIRKNLVNHLKENSNIDLANVAYTLHKGRKHFKYRKTAVCSTVPETIAALSSAKNSRPVTPARDKNRVIFMFPGFGGQAIQVNMGLELYDGEPVFRGAMDECFEILKRFTGIDMKQILYPSFSPSPSASFAMTIKSSHFDQIEIAQPVIFSFEYALAKLLELWGIIPYAMIGYSFGEFAAAAVSGVLNLEDALKLVVARVRLIGKLSGGAMSSVPLTVEQLRPLLEKEENRGVNLAIDNGTSCIVSGGLEEIAAFERTLKNNFLLCMRLPVTSYAIHSGLMNPILADLTAEAETLMLNKPRIPYISNVTGRWITDTEACDPRYWGRHLSSPVLFADGIRELLKIPGAVFVEVGPGRELTLIVRREAPLGLAEILNLMQSPPDVKKRGNRDLESDMKFLLRRVGLLWELGVSVDKTVLRLGREGCRVSLPTYPFEHQLYKVDKELISYWQGVFSGTRNDTKSNLAQISGTPIRVEAIEGAAALGATDPGTIPVSSEPPQNPVQEKLVAIWRRFFGNPGIGIRDDFFDLGGDSLKAMNVADLVHREMHVEIPVAEFFRRQTIEVLAEYITMRGKYGEYAAIPMGEKKEYYPLSPAQKRLYFLQQMILDNTVYNMPHFIPLEGEPDLAHIEEAMRRLIRRHESLRTSFVLVNSEPVQVVRDAVEFEVEYVDISVEAVNPSGNGTISIADRKAVILREFIRPFDFSKPPLVRAGIIKYPAPGAEGEESGVCCMIMLDMHHIISDGTSLLVLEKEMNSLLSGKTLPPLKLRYRDYAEWKSSVARKETLKKQKEYWQARYAVEIPVLNLAADYARPAVQDNAGADIDFHLNEEETQIVKSIASENNASLYMSLLAIYTVMLAHLSGQEDIVVGTPIQARNHTDLREVIGMFVNTLALRNFPNGEKTFTEFFAQVKADTLAAFENQEYQFEDLVDNLSVPRDAGRNPVFDVMLNILNQAEYTGPEPEINEYTGLGFEHRRGTSKFDLNLMAIDLGHRLVFNLEYSTGMFRPQTIERYIRYFKNIVSALSSNRTQTLSRIDILTPGEKEEILRSSWGTREVHPKNSVTIKELLEQQVEKTPGQTALVGPTLLRAGNETSDPVSITYSELNERSCQWAELLLDKGARPGGIVAMMVERSVEMIIIVAAIIKSGAAYLPIDPAYPAERIDYMLADSGAKTRVTTETISLSQAFYRSDKSYMSYMPPASSPLYIMYTSGSTGNPKAVIMEHRNLVNLVRYQYDYTNIDFSRVLQFTTICFDVSFQEIFSTLLAGGNLVLIDKETRGNVPGLFKIIEKHRVITLFLPTSYFKFLFGEESNGAAIPGSVRHIVTAGEQLIINPSARRYLHRNNVYLHNHYGPTESHVVTALTLDPTGEIPHRPDIGKPVMETAIYIVNIGMNLVPPGVPGEILIGGIQVARGYLNNPELTQQKFIIYNRSYRSYRSYMSYKSYNRLYRTGDLARWQSDGNIEFLGRSDHQVKIRGNRVELGEIESRLLTYPGVTQAVVIAKEEIEGANYLCAYMVSEKEIIGPGIREYLLKRLPEYMVPSYFVQLEQIPLTPNGKVDRNAMPEPVLKLGEDYTAPRGHLEERLAEIWAEVLGVQGTAGQSAQQKVSIDANFFELGGHSLKAAILVAKIHKITGDSIPLAEIFKTPTIRGIAGYITMAGAEGTNVERYASLEPSEDKEYYPLSPAQRRLYILDRMGLVGTTYNLPGVLKLMGQVDIQKLEQTIRVLIQRHESFRTSFRMLESEPVQEIHREVDFKLDVFGGPGTFFQKGSWPPEAIIRDFIRPFDLARAPLLRVGLIRNQGGEQILLVDMHHIISDGITIEIFIEEFTALNRGEKLHKPRNQYRDFSCWQHRLLQSGAIKQQEDYWLKKLSGILPELDMPLDFPRPVMKSSAGDTYSMDIPTHLLDKVKEIRVRTRTTFYQFVSAVNHVLLHKYTGQTDIIVGTPVSGRRHHDMQQIVGVFVNMVVIRSRPEPRKTFAGFLEEIKSLVLEAFENQDYPFDELVSRLGLQGKPGRNPIFDVGFLSNTLAEKKIRLNGLPVIPYEIHNRVSRFDMLVEVAEHGDSGRIGIEYSTQLFKRDSIRQMLRHFIEILNQVADNIDIKLEDIKIAAKLKEITTPKPAINFGF